MLDLDDLERKARAAEQSIWTAAETKGRMPEYHAGFAIVKADGGEQIADCYDNTSWSDAQCAANAQHIAGSSPAVVLALIAIARSAERFIDEQGKRVAMTPDGDMAISDRHDFAGEQFAELVRAVKAAGR